MESRIRPSVPQFITDGPHEGLWRVQIVGEVFMSAAELAQYQSEGFMLRGVLEPGPAGFATASETGAGGG